MAPTANNAFFNKAGYGRGKTAKYRHWLRQADAHFLVQGGKRKIGSISVPYRTRMTFPDNIRGDIDGRAKLILDWMVSRGLTIDDRYNRGLQLEYEPRPDGMVLIEVTPYDGPVEPSPGTLPSDPG